MNRKLGFIYFLPSLVFAASATPTIPSFVLEQAPQLTFQRVFQNPDRYKGQWVLWGGPILRMTRDSEGTELEILQLPLNEQGKPTTPEISSNHFIARLPQDVELRDGRGGQRVTVLGYVLGRKIRPLRPGTRGYSYPVVLGESVYIWPKPARPELPYEYPDWMGSYWDYGWSQTEWNSLYGYPR